MGYVEELNMSKIRENALTIIKKCSEMQLKDEFNNDTELVIAEVAKTWTDIYIKLGVKEVKL